MARRASTASPLGVIPYGRQSIGDDDIAGVVATLSGDWLTQGPRCGELEEALAATVHARYAVAFSSGTAALHAAAAVSGLGPGDQAVTSPLSFVASANAARYTGATVTFVDINPETMNLEPERVPPSCRALIAVHYAGLPLDLRGLRFRPRIIIEDAAHALGATTPDGPVGNCAHSDMCTFSFHPVKAITTGEGGAVTTNSPALADALRRFRNHGIARPPHDEGWFYDVSSVGFNYRLTDIQASLGLTQLPKLHRFVARRKELSSRYLTLLSAAPVTLPPLPSPGFRHAWHLFPIRIRNRGRVYERMRAAGVGVQVHYIPIYRHPLYARDGFLASDFPATEAAYAELLSLPLFVDLSERDQDGVMDALRQAL